MIDILCCTLLLQLCVWSIIWWMLCIQFYTATSLYGVSSDWQMVPRQPAQQAATQCSLNSTEACANAFSKWPLLLYLIIQNSVNLNLIAVCHGEAHWACVREQPFTTHTATASLLSEAQLESRSSPLGVCHSQKSWCHTGFWEQSGG